MPTLKELDAEFIVTKGDDGYVFQKQGHLIDGAQGIMFLCPGHKCGHKLRIWFSNPINVKPAGAHWAPEPRWERFGNSIETLTLRPSVRLRCWHGYVENGVTRDDPSP